ncbi:hypothetical protein BDK51DRAFT_12925, partial [Blyttiomyces helicus]
HSRATLFVSAIPYDATTEQVQQFFSDVGPVRSCFLVAAAEAGRNKGYGYVTFALPEDAEKALKELKKEKFLDKRTLRIELAIRKKKQPQKPKSADDAAPKTPREPREPRKEARKSRLIIRNLAFLCTEAHLRNVFKRYGRIVECSVPHLEDGKARGFGFVQFEKVEEAEKAMAGVNGTEILKRPVAVDWSIPKAHFDRAADEGDKEEGAEGEDEGQEEADGAEGAAADGEEDAAEDETHGMYEAGDSEDEEEDEDEEVEESDDDGIEVTFEKANSEGKPKKGPLSQSVTDNCTLFIRNLSFETTEEALSTAMSTFGQLRYARITMDRTTGRSRGTGFVCYRHQPDAAACLAAYDAACKSTSLLDRQSMYNRPKDAPGKKKSSASSAPSILVPEPSLSSSSTPFLLDGRFLNVALAVPRGQADQLAHEGKLRRRAEDKRNLYLMREGVIFPESDAAATLTPAELSKRQTSFAERKRILATNPNLFMSKTRLSVRNLGLRVDDKELKKVALLAVKKFWDEVGKGAREGLEAEVVEEEVAEGRAKPSATRKPVLKQAKIMRTKDRIDALTKLPRSKGFGFIEFASHADALACLRWLNNNPRAF